MLCEIVMVQSTQGFLLASKNSFHGYMVDSHHLIMLNSFWKLMYVLGYTGNKLLLVHLYYKVCFLVTMTAWVPSQ